MNKMVKPYKAIHYTWSQLFNSQNSPWLILPVVFMSILDLAVTLFHQPSIYWQGHYESAIEGNPLVLFFMNIHPTTMLIGWLIAVTAICYAVLKLQIDVAIDISRFFIFGHALCSCGWLWRHSWAIEYSISILSIAFILILLVGRAKTASPTSTENNLHSKSTAP